jgi:hypothetical protein
MVRREPASADGGPPGQAPRGRKRPAARRALQLALAALWLLDAVPQYQTFMFSEGFPRMLAATAAGNPVRCPGLAACCQIVMGVAMAYMLILML